MNTEQIKQLRIKMLLKWIEENSDLLSSNDSVKIVFNIKGMNLIPEITIYPGAVKQ